MANFPGVNYRGGLIGDGFGELDNTSHVDRDVLRRRPGYSRVAANPADYGTPYDGVAIIHAADDTLRSVNPVTGAVSASLGTVAGSGNFARFGGRLYWSSASADSLVLDSASSTARTPGIAAPGVTIGTGTVTPSGGSITVGAHLFRYRYKNSTTGALSNPSGAITKTLTQDDLLTFTIGTSGTHIIIGPANADRIVLEATVTDGTEFFAAYEVANSAGSIAFSLGDVALSEALPVSYYGDDGHAPMPRFDFICEHRSRLYGVQLSTRSLAWSRPGYPESWDITRYARTLATVETGDPISAIASFQGDLYLFTRYGMSRFTYAESPDAGTVLTIPTDEGVWNPRCVVQIGNAMYGLGPSGVWVITAMNPVHISTDVDPFIEDTIDIDDPGTPFGWYNPEDRSITWMLTATRGITYSLPLNAWSTRTYEAELVSGFYAYRRNFLSTATHLWRERADYNDGVSGVAAFTVSAPPGGTTIATVEATADYVGMMLSYGTESRRITAYGANSLTIASAFSTVPPAGTVLYVGRIRLAVESDWQTPDQAQVSNPVYLLLSFEPQDSNRTFKVSIYRDFQASALTLIRDMSDTPPSGVSYNSGDTEMTVQADGGDGKGYVPVPLTADFSRCVKFRLVFDQPTTGFGLSSARWGSRDDIDKIPGGGE